MAGLKSAQGSSEEVPRPWLLALMALAAAIRFTALARQSFWYDEAVSAVMARHSLEALLSGQAKDLGNPPLYPIVLHLWETFFGASDAALRALSALMGTATVPLAYAAGRRVLPARTAYLGALLLALAPFHLQMAQEARTYTLLTFCGTASVAALLAALDAPARWGRWVLFGVATGAMVLCHYFGFFLAFGEALYVLGLHRRFTRADRAVIGRALVGFAVGAALFSFWLPSFFSQLGVKGNLARSAESWHLHLVATPLVFGVGSALVWKDSVSAPRLALAALATLALVALCLLGIWKARHRHGVVMLLLWLVMPVALPALVSALASPLYNTRYVILGSIPFYLFAGAGLRALRPRMALAGGGLVLVSFAAAYAAYFGRPVKHQWRSAAALVEGAMAPGDVLLFDADYDETAYAHYGHRAGARVRLLPPPDGAPAEHLYGALAEGAATDDVTDLVRGHRRAWLVLADARPDASERDLRFFEGWHAHEPITLRGITIQLFEH